MTKRQIEVLALVAQGMTNQEIPHRLMIDQHTVALGKRGAFGGKSVYRAVLRQPIPLARSPSVDPSP